MRFSKVPQQSSCSLPVFPLEHSKKKFFEPFQYRKIVQVPCEKIQERNANEVKYSVKYVNDSFINVKIFLSCIFPVLEFLLYFWQSES